MPAVQAGKAQNVTLVVDDVPVVQVLQALAAQEKKNLVVSPDVSGSLSLSLTDVPWKQAVQTVIKSAGLVLRQEGNILHVHSVHWQNETPRGRRLSRQGFGLTYRWRIAVFLCNMPMPPNWQKREKNC